MAPTIFDVCTPRADVLAGAIAESDFAADLAQVIRGSAPPEYADPARFFDNTFPTRGLRNLLANVCARLSGAGSEAASIFRLDTQFGGGKTHGLIALVHAARSGASVPNIAEFIDPELLPSGAVRIAAFDGENADPANGRSMGDGLRAYTPWGEIAYALAGAAGYERVRASDEDRVAPGAETLRELFAGEPTLVLLDELSVYLRKVKRATGARDQLTAFLTSLFKAIESSPNAALVYTLAVGKDQVASDAYSDENEHIAARMAEAESISARKATLLNPTEDDETAQVLVRRLFARVDRDEVARVVEAYREIWRQNEAALSEPAKRPETADAFRASYPLHPEVLDTLTEKAATLSNFQRVRGMLRLLARTVALLWSKRPGDATAIHLHHIDVAHDPIRQELITRLGLTQYVPALRRDVAGEGGVSALAQEIDADNYAGMPPFASYVARTIFLHNLASHEQLRGLSADELRFAMVGPAIDVSFVEDARKRFIEGSAFLDDRPGARLRFVAEPNLTQVIRRQEGMVDAEDARAQLRDRIHGIFKRTTDSAFDLIPFPGGAYEVPDEIGTGRPLLVVIGFDAVSIGASVDTVPRFVTRIFNHRGADDAKTRINRNALVFLVADEARKDEMRSKMTRRLALRDLKSPERLTELADHQQEKVREMEARSEQELALAIQQCYRHVFYPSRNGRVNDEVELAHTAIDVPSASANPGAGQRQVERVLRDANKLRVSGDQPDSPSYMRDATPLKKGEMSTRGLREEYRRNAALAMLVGDDVFLAGVRRGIEGGEYVYRRKEFLYGQGDPTATIEIDEEAMVFTRGVAEDRGIWPRPKPQPSSPGTGSPGSSGAVAAGVEETRLGRADTGPGDPTPTSGGNRATSVPTPSTLVAEGVLKEALTMLWEKVRARKIGRLHAVGIRMHEKGDAFRLLGTIGSIPGASKSVKIVVAFETADEGDCSIEYDGPVSDALPLKEFLEPQLRAARDSDLKSEFELVFDGGLEVTGDGPEKLAEKLSRSAAGSAFVTASAHPVTSASSGGAS